MLRKHLCCLVFVLALGGARPVTKAEVFTDGFEGPTLSPFWYVQGERSGQVIFPSTGQAQGGSQSLQLESLPGAGTIVIVAHDFAAPIYGTLSVWMYDGYAGQETNCFFFGALNTRTSDLMYVGTEDWIATKYFALTMTDYRIRSYHEAVDRVNGWHHLEMTSVPNDLTLRVDGQTLVTESKGTPFDRISLEISGPPGRPSYISVYWDDFAMDIIPVPEPSTVVLCAIGGAIAGLYVWRQRRRNV